MVEARSAGFLSVLMSHYLEDPPRLRKQAAAKHQRTRLMAAKRGYIWRDARSGATVRAGRQRTSSRRRRAGRSRQARQAGGVEPVAAGQSRAALEVVQAD